MSTEPASPRVRLEKDARGTIIVLDDTDSTQQEAWAAFRAFDEYVKGLPDKSVRVLANFTGAWHEGSLTQAWQAAHAHHERVVLKAAVFGAARALRLAVTTYRFYSRLQGLDVDKRIRMFDSEEEARAWLAEV